MEAGFTKGLWKVGYTDAVSGAINVFDETERFLIASVSNAASAMEIIHGREPNIQRANARLIAAAPDLYEALTLMLAPMPEHLDGCLWKNDRRMPCQCGQSDRLHTAQSVALGKARAALLKAQSGEPK